MPASTQIDNSPVNQPASPTRFSRARFALVLMFGIYPLITGLLYLVLPLTEGWALWLRTIIIVPIMVVVMTWGLIPAMQKLFRRFLNPRASAKAG